VNATSRRGFYFTTRAHRCPVCNGERCSLTRDGVGVWCRRVTSPTQRGGLSWHRLDGTETHEPPPLVELHPRADVATLDAVHRRVLASLRLNEAHRNQLQRRGLDDTTIAANDYRSLLVEGRASLAASLVEAFGADVAASIPGLYSKQGKRGAFWSLAGAAGLLIPCRDVDGRIVALKVRRDDAGDGPKYLYLSSSKHGGASALAAVHVPSSVRGPCCEVRVTEGELKSDVATALSGLATISIPGVGTWRKAFDVLRALQCNTVRVAFDSDAQTNPTVARAQLAFVRALRADGFRVRLETWDCAHKGIDDFLAAVTAIRRAS